MKPQEQAAHALLEHCRTHPTDPVFPEESAAKQAAEFSATMMERSTDPAAHPLLIEGNYEDGILAVTMPDGQVWRYTLAIPGKGLFRRALLVCIHHRDPHTAACFRPTGEGIHPFVGIAHRFGVENMERGAAQ